MKYHKTAYTSLAEDKLGCLAEDKLGCSKHVVEDTIIKLKQCKKCAFCWFLLHRHFSKL